MLSNFTKGTQQVVTQISINCDHEKETITEKHRFAGFSTRCFDNAIRQVQKIRQLTNKQNMN